MQLVLEPSGIPLVALYDDASAPFDLYNPDGRQNAYIPQDQPVTVGKYDGAGWTTLGTPEFATGVYPSLALDANGVPHLALGDASVSRRATVLRFTSAGWEPVGARGFSAGAAYWNHLAVDPLGTVHLAFMDDSMPIQTVPAPYEGPIVVQRFQGTWLNVGNNEQVQTYASANVYPALAFDPAPKATPFVAFSSPVNFAVMRVYRNPGPPPSPPVSAESDGVL